LSNIYKFISSSLICLIAIFIIGEADPLKTNAESNEMASSQRLAEIYYWHLDEGNGYIYAFQENNKLLFIGLNDLKISKEIQLDSYITEIESFGGKLYLAMPDKIVIIDIANKSVERTISVDGAPIDIAVDEESIFIVYHGTGSQKVFRYNLKENKGEEVKHPEFNSFYEPAIAIDSENDVLYIGSSGLSQGSIVALSTIDYSHVSKSTFKNRDGFTIPNRNVIFDDGAVFYAGYQLNSKDLSVVEGTYGNSIKDVYGNYVFSDKEVFNRDTFTAFPIEMIGDVMVDRHDNVYYYAEDETIKREKFSLSLDDEERFWYEKNKIAFENAISDWVFDQENNMIYAVSKDANKLYYIQANDLTVKHEMFIGSMPTDIEMYNGKLYVGLYGATKIAVTDVNYSGKVDEIAIHTNAKHIQVGKDRLFYVSYPYRQWLSAYDFKTGAIEKEMVYLHSPRIYFDRNRGVLYAGETGLSGSALYAFTGSDLSKVYESNYNDGYGFGYPQSLFLDDQELIFGSYIVNPDDVNEVRGQISVSSPGEGVIGVADSFAISNHYIYDRNSKKVVSELPFTASLFAENKDGAVYINGEKNNTIVKYNSIDDLAADWPLIDEDVDIQVPSKMLYDYNPDDIDGHWASEHLWDFLSSDLLAGYKNEDGSVSLQPNSSITRAEFVTILVRALGLKTENIGGNFRDVSHYDWYYEPVQIASDHGIANGISEDLFAPNEKVKRDEMAAMIVRAFASSIDFEGAPKEFKDVPAYWATDAINKASSAGIITGVSENQFNPFANAKRAEAVVMLYRALHMESQDLPSDEELENVVLQFETEMADAYKQKDLTKASNITNQYTTGFYNVETNFNVYIAGLIDRNVDRDTTLKGELSAVVIDKSDRFAAVELKGAVYEILYQKGDLIRTETQDTSGTFYLKKMPNDEGWKIYNSYLPNLYSSTFRSISNMKNEYLK
jgi:hypothetical protein